jgi:prepilin-type N-terminal cleavage/methylation domain-containing protein
MKVSTPKCETRPTRGSFGFTLIELAVVLSVIAVVTAVVLGGIEAIRKRASYSGSVGDIVTSLRKTRAEAFGRGIYTAFIVDTVGGRWWGIEAPNGISLSTFNPSAPGTLILSGTLPNGTVFGPTAGYGLALADPFAGIPVLSGQSPNLNYCSFCNTSPPNQGFGEILFEPAGSVQFSGGPPAVGQQFTLQGTIQSSGISSVRTTAVAITGFNGVIEQFEQ